jgi:hypothetical protein
MQWVCSFSHPASNRKTSDLPLKLVSQPCKIDENPLAKLVLFLILYFNVCGDPLLFAIPQIDLYQFISNSFTSLRLPSNLLKFSIQKLKATIPINLAVSFGESRILESLSTGYPTVWP